MTRRAFDFRPNAQLYQDPLLARILTLDTLAPAERLDWISSVTALLKDQRAELANEHAAGHYDVSVCDARLRVIDVYLSCLEELHARVIHELETSRGASSMKKSGD